MKQLGLALHNYHETFSLFPPLEVVTAGWLLNAQYGGASPAPGWTAPNSWGSYNGNWITLTLPFVELGPLYNQFNFASNTGANGTLIKTPLKHLICPSNTQGIGSLVNNSAITHYYAMQGANTSLESDTWANAGTTDGKNAGIFFHDSHTSMADVTDGTSNTIMVSEAIGFLPVIPGQPATNCVAPIINATSFGTGVADGRGTAFSAVTKSSLPINVLNCQTRWFPSSSFHAGGAHQLLTDGSCRFASQNIDATVWLNLGSRGDGQRIGDW